MKSNFAEILSTLRHRRGISQRQAAADLGISQALLSHYENDAREPKLGFVVRACDYYDVPADYILGRSDAPTAKPQPEPCGCAGSPRLMSATRAVFDKLDEISDPELYSCAVDYLIIPAENAAALLLNPNGLYDPMRDAEWKRAEAALVENARRLN